MHGATIKTRLLLVAAALTLLSACASGPREVRGELPLITLDGLERRDAGITLLLGLRNINDRPFPLTEVEVQLRVGGELLLSVIHTPDFELGPRGREVLVLRGPGQDAGLRTLDRLEPAAAQNDVIALGSIDWSMDLRLNDERGRSRTTESSGFLHPVPGQPGRFR